MKAIFLLAVLSVLAILPARSDASPIVVYNNLGAGQTYNTSIGWSVEGTDTYFGQFEGAEPFTPTSTVTFDAVLLPLGILQGTNSVIVSLVPNASGQPGATPLESFTLTGLSSFYTGGSVDQLNSVLDPVLNAGVTYWITVFPGGSTTDASWFENTTGADQFSSSDNGGTTWHNSAPNTAPAMEILGNPLATPEPSALAMLAGMGAGACTFGLRRMRRKSAAA